MAKDEEEERYTVKKHSKSNVQTLNEPVNTTIEVDKKEAQATSLLLAKEYLDDAFSHGHINFIPTAYHVGLYSSYKRKSLVFLSYFFYIVNISLALFERPSVPCLGVPYWITIIIEIVCLSYFIFRFCHEMLFTQLKSFWTDPSHVRYATILILTVIDIVIYTTIVESSRNQNHPAAIR